MESDRLRLFNTELAGNYVRRQTREDPDLFEASGVAAKLNSLIQENLEAGEIPVWVKKDKGDNVIRVNPMFSEEKLRSMWKKYSSMTDEDMDKKIEGAKKVGIYASE